MRRIMMSLLLMTLTSTLMAAPKTGVFISEKIGKDFLIYTRNDIRRRVRSVKVIKRREMVPGIDKKYDRMVLIFGKKELEDDKELKALVDSFKNNSSVLVWIASPKDVPADFFPQEREMDVITSSTLEAPSNKILNNDIIPFLKIQ